MDDTALHGYLSGDRSPASWDHAFQQQLCGAILMRPEGEIIEILGIVDRRAGNARTSTGYDTRWSLLLEDLGEALAAGYASSERDRRLLMRVSRLSLDRKGDLPFDHYKRRKYLDLLGPQAGDYLVALLEGHPRNYFIVESLVAIADPRTATILVDALFMPTKTPYIKCKYIDWVADHAGIEDPFSLIEPCVDDHDDQIRIHSMQVLSRLDPTRAQPVVCELLSDDLPGIRQAALDTLATGMPDATTVGLVAERLESDPSVEVRIAAARALGTMKPAEAPPALAGGLRDAHHDVRGMSAWALGQIGDQSALDVLRACRDDPYELAAWSILRAIEALEALGGR